MQYTNPEPSDKELEESGYNFTEVVYAGLCKEEYACGQLEDEGHQHLGKRR